MLNMRCTNDGSKPILDLEVVSIGTNPTFNVKKVPKEYVPTMPKRLHFFGSWLYKTNIDDLVWERVIVGTYSIGTNLTLKVGLVPMETTLEYSVQTLIQKYNSWNNLQVLVNVSSKKTLHK